MNFQKYFLQLDTEQQLSKDNINENKNNNDNSNNIKSPKKQFLTKNQKYEIDRKNFFKENRQRAKPLLSKQGIYNRRFENNSEWGHNTLVNFRGVKGTDWTRDHGFTYANDFNTLERDIDSDYERPNLKNCRYCLNTYLDTEPHKILENDPPTEIGGCIKCCPEHYINNHNDGKDDYYPVKSTEMNSIKSEKNLNLHHITRNCTSIIKSHSTGSVDKIRQYNSLSTPALIESQPDWETISKNKINDNSDTILIDQNNSNVFIGDYHCRDHLKSHLNTTGFHSDDILAAGVKSVNNTKCCLKNVTYDNTSNILFNDEYTALNIEKEKPTYKALIRYDNQSFIPFNHIEYNPNPDKEHKEFDNKVYKYPNKMRINPEYDYNDTENNYKVPYNNNSTYDDFIKENKDAPQNMYYKDLYEQYKHIYNDNKNTLKSENNEKSENNDDKNKNTDNKENDDNNNNDYTSRNLEKFSMASLLCHNNILNENGNLLKAMKQDKNQTSNNSNSDDDNSNHYHSTKKDNFKYKSSDYDYFFCGKDLDLKENINDSYESEDFRKEQLKISAEQGFLNGYLPNKYQNDVESYDNPMLHNPNVKSSMDIEADRRLIKMKNLGFIESIDNILAYQFNSIYETKEKEKRERFCNKMNCIRYDTNNIDDFVSLTSFNSKLNENLVPSKETEKQKYHIENTYYGLYPDSQKRHGNAPPFDKEKLKQETPIRFMNNFGVEYDKGVMRCREPPFDDCNCWINDSSKPKFEQPLPYLYASRNIIFNELKVNDYISPNLKRLLEQDYRNTGKIAPSESSKVSPKNRIQFHNNSYINKDDLDELIINHEKDSSKEVITSSTKKTLAPKRITCRDRTHNYVIYDYESIKAKNRNNNRIKNLVSKQKVFNSSLNVLG
ncbi:hypothetical protein LY90DRAFT_671496 [Neocallimastix californiae]|uniref:Uncharacterized protein n=1 Tax=Neocallimastix californiae TaxID=1754190 RepID=A0A1Y2CFX8_9FUNG|nr:hypothetical protein LY90DRAFT_671496 [Neocallimastix californiae]|eukprot:ORY45836.1 hypothetical protein LY90DRAFT_671496 [Neocallimastix californiae]